MIVTFVDHGVGCPVMARLTSSCPVRLTRRRRKALTRIAGQASGEFRQVQRARILLAAAGKVPNAQIARRMQLSEGTVRTHLNHIYERLGVISRTAAVARVSTAGLE